MSLIVEDLKLTFPDLPQEFVDLIPVTCTDCGSALTISEALTGLSCSNRTCPGKMSMRVKAICKELNILGFGASTIDAFIDTYSPSSPMNIFELEPGMSVGNGVSPKISEKITDQLHEIRENSEFLLWEAVKIQNLPGIQTAAQKIFTGYSDIDLAYQDLHEGGIDWVSNRLGIQGGAGVRAVSVYSTLVQYEDDVKEACAYFRIVDAGNTPELTVVVSDQAGEGFSSKNDFYNRAREQFKGRYLFNFAPSVSAKGTDYLIWAGADGSPARYTSKVSKVEGYNAKGSQIPILTGQQFLDHLESGLPVEHALTLNSDSPVGTEEKDRKSVV